MEQTPFIDIEFANNPEQRCACLLILDNSGSMSGTKINELNAGLRLFQNELNSDSLASKRVEIGIISFGPVKVVQDFTSIYNMSEVNLQAEGGTPMGEAIKEGIKLLERRKMVYKENGVPYYRPWIFLITDGEPTDSINEASQLVKEGEELKKFSFFAVGVDDANMSILRKISVREPLKLRGMSFRELFVWLTSSMKNVSHSMPNEKLMLQSPKGWAEID